MCFWGRWLVRNLSSKQPAGCPNTESIPTWAKRGPVRQEKNCFDESAPHVTGKLAEATGEDILQFWQLQRFDRQIQVLFFGSYEMDQEVTECRHSLNCQKDNDGRSSRICRASVNWRLVIFGCLSHAKGGMHSCSCRRNPPPIKLVEHASPFSQL